MRNGLTGGAVASLLILTLPCMALAEQSGVGGSVHTGVQRQEQYAASKPLVRHTVRGRLIVGTLEGVIETSTGTMYHFATKDRISRQLMAACRGADFCEADVMLDSGEIMRVRSARPVLKSALSDKERDEWSKRLSNE
jgi:hypothetical protein